MSADDLAQSYLAARETDPELEADLARFGDIGRKSAEKGFLTQTSAQDAATIKSGGQAGETGVSHWFMNLPRNITVAVMDAGMNMVEFGGDVVEGMGEGERLRERAKAGKPASDTPQEKREKSLAAPPVPNELMEAGRQLRGELALGSTGADELTQSAAQFFLPFAGWSKAMGGFQKGKTLLNVGKAATAETATMVSAFEPHESRFADLLRMANTNNELVNTYIDYMAADADEGEWEGRFKNAADSLATSAAIASVIKAGGITLKQARKLAKKPKTEEAQ